MNLTIESPLARALKQLRREAEAADRKQRQASGPETPEKAPGRLSQALIRLLMRRSRVVATEQLADRFKLITLEGQALQGVAWTPGQKVQIAMGSAFVARTYTPVAWNAAAGRTCILGYAHGDGPGSAWVRRVEAGEECDLFGPRASVDTRRMAGPILLFGDETSIGLAHALVQAETRRPVTCLFEVDDVDAAQEVLRQLAIDDAVLYARQPDDAHLEAVAAQFVGPAADGSHFMLTGKAGSIQRLRQRLKLRAVPAANVHAKAYWAPGKTGLD